jgi:hypothetical protein
MKSYRLSRRVSWFLSIAKVALTVLAGWAYVLAVTHPTPLAGRLLLLLVLAAFIWLFYVRLPSMPSEIDVNDDGWVSFRGRRGTQQVHVASIRSIGRGLLGKTVRVRHGGGKLQMPGGVKNFYDFLATVKGMNPVIDIRGF